MEKIQVASTNQKSQFPHALEYALAKRQPLNITSWIALACCIAFILIAGALLALPRPDSRQSAWMLAVILVLLPLLGFLLAIAARCDRSNPNQKIAKWATILALIEFAGGSAFLLSPVNYNPGPSNKTRCMHQLHEIGLSISLYLNSNRGNYPPDLAALLSEDIPPEMLICPAPSDTPAKWSTTQATMQILRTTTGHCSYVYCAQGLTRSTVTPAHVIAYDRAANHANNGINVLFGDGSVRWLDKQGAAYLITELNAGFNPPRSAR